MKTSAFPTILLVAALTSGAAIQPSSTLESRDAPPAHPTTTEYGSLGPGVYAHHVDGQGNMYFEYMGPNSSSASTKDKRDSSIFPVDNYKRYYNCPSFRSNVQQDPNKGPYGDWCEIPNDDDKIPWKCDFHNRAVDTIDLTTAYTNMENLLGTGYRITNKALSTTGGTGIAYICNFATHIDYDKDHFKWMMKQLDIQCTSNAGADYYDGKKYAVGRTSNTDRDNCAFRID